MRWITEPGIIAELFEKQNAVFPFLTTSENATFTTPDAVKLANAGFILSGNGIFQGTVAEVDIADPNYILKSSLPVSEQVKYLANVRGYLDLEFSVTADDGDVTITGVFYVRLVDFDNYPYWIPDLQTIELPEISTGDTVSIDFIDSSNDPYVFDPDGDSLDFNIIDGEPKLLIGELPINLTLDQSGKIIGTVASFPNNMGLTRTYQFIIRVSDGLFFVDKMFIMRVKRINNSIPIWDDVTSPESSVRDLVTITIAQPVDFRILANDADFDTLFYKMDTAFPIEGLNFDNGRIYGTVSLTNVVGDYTFTVGVTDRFTLIDNPTESDYQYEYRTFIIQVDPYDNRLNTIEQTVLEWITPAGSLGKLFQTEPCFYSIEVETNSNVRFDIVSGSLPDGLQLTATGLLVGRATQPGTFVFQVIVYLINNPTVFLIRQFEITIVEIYQQDVAYIRSNTNQLIKTEILNVLSTINLELFRQIDANFTASLNPYIMSTPLVTKQEFFDIIKNKLPSDPAFPDPRTWTRENTSPQQNYHSKLTLRTSNVRAIPVVIDDTYYYDTIVLDLYDPAQNIGGFKDGVYDKVKYAAADPSRITNPEEILPSSVRNWRNDIAIENELLPRWMENKFQLALVLAFVKPNTGKNIETQLRGKLFGKEIIIDNYIYNDSFRFKFLPGDIH